MFKHLLWQHKNRWLIAAWLRDRQALRDRWLEEAYQMELAEASPPRLRYVLDWAWRVEAR